MGGDATQLLGQAIGVGAVFLWAAGSGAVLLPPSR